MQVAIETYVNALGIGADVILAEVIATVMALPGVADVAILTPTSNVSIPGGTLVRITDSDITVV